MVARRSDQPLSLTDVNYRYPGEWIVLQVTDVDADGAITRGRVLDHSPSRKQVSKTVKRAHEENPNQHLYVFVAGAAPESAQQFRQEVADADAYLNARW